MSDYVVQVQQSVPEDDTILELSATITDAGVEIYAKSPSIHSFVKNAANDTSFDGGDWVLSFAGKKFFSLPARYLQGVGGNVLRDDLLLSRGELFDPGEERIRVEGATPNYAWLRSTELDTGVTLVLRQPAHMPADIVEFLSRALEGARSFHMRYIRKTKVTGNLREVSRG